MTHDARINVIMRTTREVDGDLLFAAAPLRLPMPDRAVVPSIFSGGETLRSLEYRCK
jgi:hypothetical protein